ncbi:MAG: hypothetical protein CMN75_00185 [Spirochaeta sp.]|nr:hypothetical protein [Spirochaeta sp.]
MQCIRRAAASEHLLRTATRPTQPLLTIRCQHAENTVFETSTQERTNILLMLRTLIRIKSDTNEVTGSINKIRGREQTVLRSSIARSEDA